MQHADLVRIAAGTAFFLLVCLVVWRRKRKR
jgi:hypothetical protein